MQQTTTNTATSSTPATAAEQGLLALGYERGAPPHVRAATQAIDRQVCRQSRCGSCGRRGLSYRPFHRGREYRVLAVCPACQAAKEV
jgi:hypothetical protein